MSAGPEQPAAATAPRAGRARFVIPIVGMVVIEWLLVTPRLPLALPGQSDKLAHGAAFAALAAAWWWALTPRRSPLSAALLAVGIAAFWGGLGEIQQRFVPGRTAAIDDFLADVGGAALAVTPLCLWVRRRRPPVAPGPASG